VILVDKGGQAPVRYVGAQSSSSLQRDDDGASNLVPAAS
jgi:hypothetical protein